MSGLLGYMGYEFGRNALMAGTLVALLSAVVGFFVVLRRMAFVASGISHAALGGVAIGVLLHQSPVLWAIAFSIVVALLMAALGKRGVHEDTAMGVFFPASMAFGVVVVSFSRTWQSDLLSYLFGNILASRSTRNRRTPRASRWVRCGRS
ncbi:MAG: metal ABC transporter permease [Armatimonadetes bacterium]|nr:metal ABC transporter permease [Armatimonadota bacterium]